MSRRAARHAGRGSTHRRRARIIVRTTVLALLAAVTLGSAHHPAGAAFSGSADDSGNTVKAKKSFCPASGDSITLTVVDGIYVDRTFPGSVMSSTIRDVWVRSLTGSDSRVWLRFDLASAKPRSWCSTALSTATLRVFNTNADTGRTIDVLAGTTATPAWTTATLTWNNQPYNAGRPKTSLKVPGSGWNTWNVKAQITQQFADLNAGSPDNGLVLKDSAESAPAPAKQNGYTIYDVNPGTPNAPQLVLTW